MDINEGHIVGGPLVLATPADVDALERQLWITFPAGYRLVLRTKKVGKAGHILVAWRRVTCEQSTQAAPERCSRNRVTARNPRTINPAMATNWARTKGSSF
jgi:hypothetical protein